MTGDWQDAQNATEAREEQPAGKEADGGFSHIGMAAMQGPPEPPASPPTPPVSTPEPVSNPANPPAEHDPKIAINDRGDAERAETGAGTPEKRYYGGGPERGGR